jgi:hypothetical protein
MDMNQPRKPEQTFLLTPDELQRELTALENGSFTSLSDDELREKIRVIHAGFTLQAPIFPAGTAIYRAVKVSQRPANRLRVGYPPAEVVRDYGRLNRIGEVMFYGAFHLGSCLQECAWQVGDFFAVSGWLTSVPMTFNHLGYSQAVLQSIKSNRDLPSFTKLANDSDRNVLIREWQARVFTQQVNRGEEHIYRLPIALRDFALSKMVQTDPKAPDVFSGVIYPSVATWLLADNVAILPREVDTKLALFEVILLTLDSVTEVRRDDGSTETKKAMKTYDFARSDVDGNLKWGQKSQIVYPDGVDASQFTPMLLPPV